MAPPQPRPVVLPTGSPQYMYSGNQYRFTFSVDWVPFGQKQWFIDTILKPRLYQPHENLRFLFWDQPTDDTFEVVYEVLSPPIAVYFVATAIVGLALSAAVVLSLIKVENITEVVKEAKVPVVAFALATIAVAGATIYVVSRVT